MQNIYLEFSAVGWKSGAPSHFGLRMWVHLLSFLASVAALAVIFFAAPRLARKSARPSAPADAAPALNFSQLVRAVELLPYSLPTRANQLTAVAAGQASREAAIARMAEGTAPFLHQRTWQLAESYLALKRRAGSEVERRVYAAMGTADFIARLLSRRPLVFMDVRDAYLLQTGEHGEGGFFSINTDAESPPLVMSRYLTYDEMEVAACWVSPCPRT